MAKAEGDEEVELDGVVETEEEGGRTLRGPKAAATWLLNGSQSNCVNINLDYIHFIYENKFTLRRLLYNFFVAAAADGLMVVCVVRFGYERTLIHILSSMDHQHHLHHLFQVIIGVGHQFVGFFLIIVALH